MSFVQIRWRNGRPYKYRMATRRIKRHGKNVPRSFVIEYLGRARPSDVRKYYRGKKVETLTNIYLTGVSLTGARAKPPQSVEPR